MASVTANCYFQEGTKNWFVLAGGDPDCRLVRQDVKDLPDFVERPRNSFYVSVSGRKSGWNGLAQDIELKAKCKYKVTAEVAIKGAISAGVWITIALKNRNGSDWKGTNNPYINVGSVTANETNFVTLNGLFRGIDTVPPKVTVYVEGPPGGVDLLVASFTIVAVEEAPPTERPKSGPFRDLGLNIVENGDFQKGTSSWGSMACSESLKVIPASPCGSPNGPPIEPSSLPSSWPQYYPLPTFDNTHSSFNASPQNSFNCYSCCPDGPTYPPVYPISSPVNRRSLYSLSDLSLSCKENSLPSPLAGPTGPYLIVGNRTAEWQGPMQKLTKRVKPSTTYAVTAWVRIGREGDSSRPISQSLNMAISVDGQWINGGMVETHANKWVRSVGSFRVEKQPVDVTLYVQGAKPGVDIWLADVRVIEVDWKARIEELKAKAEEVRKRNVTIKIRDACGNSVSNAFVTIEQTERAFPLGTCINNRDIQNPQYQQFFLKHFNFAVFENELKWVQMERIRGEVDYTTADFMLQWLENHKIPVRGHCIFWDNEFPEWIRRISDEEAAGEVDRRLTELVGRCKGRFQHYDVNNEMLHGGYFADRFGPGIITRMFQLAFRLDPSAKLFVNDYHVGDGCDWKSTPEKYVESIQGLLNNGAPVGGIGIQGHITAPVGVHFRDTLDKLAQIGLPIWLTEMDVNSTDETVRANDLEIMLREAFAHPVVEGVVLWGFWKGAKGAPAMAIPNAHLVEEDWSLNAAGRRLEALQKEWTTANISGHVDAHGAFPLRGFLGKYKVKVERGGSFYEQTFVIENGTGVQTVKIVI